MPRPLRSFDRERCSRGWRYHRQPKLSALAFLQTHSRNRKTAELLGIFSVYPVLEALGEN